MAFLNLRNNNQIYVLYKDLNPHLEVGKVISVTPPTPKFGPNNMYNSLVVDLLIDINGNITNLLKLPADSNIADFGNNMVVACNKDVMNNEISSMKLKSLDILNSIELHKTIINNCDQMLLILNPEIAERLKQEKESLELREELNLLKTMFKEFMTSFK